MKRLLFLTTAVLVASASTLPAQEHFAFASIPWLFQGRVDPADSMFRAGRRQLTDRDYGSAVKTFDALVKKYPKSTYAADSYYWIGWATYRISELPTAQAALEKQLAEYPNAPTSADAQALLIVVKGELAKRGNAEARRDVDSAATKAASGTAGCEDMEMRIAALDAVQQMDGDRAVPLLKRVLQRRDPCSLPLRKNALFILASRAGNDRETILLDVAKNDPSLEMKKDAVFHLSSASSSLAVDALEELLLRGTDNSMRSDALFALAGMSTDRSTKLLREFALSSNAPAALRKDAFFHLASRSSGDDQAWLIMAYSRVTEAPIRNDLLFQIASREGSDVNKWLAGIAKDEKEPMESRKNAVFHLASRSGTTTELIAVYDAVSVPLKKELIFHFGSRMDGPALDKLIVIAKRDTSLSLRKEALFHLSSSKDPKAMKAIEDLVVP